MNLQEFAALKPGDRIENAMSSSQGEVVEADATGVRVRWSGAGLVPFSLDRSAGQPAGTTRHYSAQTTIWFHWSKVRVCPNVGPELDRAISDELANPPASIVGDA